MSLWNRVLGTGPTGGVGTKWNKIGPEARATKYAVLGWKTHAASCTTLINYAQP